MRKIIGFIGQGWIGKNYADDFENRGFEVVRYSLDEEYLKNKESIKDCYIVFIAVPTPTTPQGFDFSAVRDALSLVGKGNIAVIKSTILPGTTEVLQREFPEVFILFSPEFLSVVSAKFDTENPARNIIGLPVWNNLYKDKANLVLSVLPRSKYQLICKSSEAEVIKYAKNCIGYARVIMSNIFFEVCKTMGTDYDVVKEAISNDPDFGPTYTNAVHKSGRGAGGGCFIKDFSAFKNFYKDLVKDQYSLKVLSSIEEKNLQLLIESDKDLDLLKGVYGEGVF